MALISKYQIEEILILPFGGITKIKKDLNSDIKKDLLLASGGIIFQIIFLTILIIIYLLGFLAYKPFYLLIYYNLIIIIFNLIPIIPLDGHYILRYLIELFLPYYKAFYITLTISIILLTSFVILNIITGLNNYLIIGFLVYKLIIEFKNFKYQFNRFLLERIIKEFNFKKIKIINGINLKKMYRNKYHFFLDKGKVISEKNVLYKLKGND